MKVPIDMLCCPKCRAAVSANGPELVCAACGTAYPVVKGIPVLINEANSVFSINQFVHQEATFFARESRIRKLFFSLVPSLSMNRRAAQNYRRLGEMLQGRSERPRILVIGGGIVGEGMEELLAFQEFEFYETDVTFEPRTMLICDAHDIPFRDGLFDLVIAQAVMEHVVDPNRCVQEVHRVLKPHGLVYAETPFMQQAHALPFDFQRFTAVGHRRLFRHFEEIEQGPVGGPGQALGWSYQHFLLSFSSNRAIRAMLYFIARWTSFWLKYLDVILNRHKDAVDAAFGLYFIGRKTDRPVSDKEILNRFKAKEASSTHA